MAHALTKNADIFKLDKHEINLRVYPNFNECGFVVVETKTGHNQEFKNSRSTYHYIILEGNGSFFLDDDEVGVEKGDLLSIEPNTRIYYKGNIKLVLLTTPAWREEDETETKSKVW